MIRFVGLDVHIKEVQACIRDPRGDILAEHRFPATREAICAFAVLRLEQTDQVALEATFHSWAIADLLEPRVARVVVSNPMQTKAIAQAKIKTDKVDARVLSNLLRCNYLPEVWKPDMQTRQMRTLAGRRCGLVRQRTCIKNRIHGVLARLLITKPATELFSPTGRQWLAAIEVDPITRKLLDTDLMLLDQLEAQLRSFEDEMAQRAYQDPRARLLMTLPGVDFATAQTLIAALGDITRFSDGDHAAAYLGLVPSTYQSGEHCYHGHMTKRGNSKARWMLIQGAQHLGRNPGPLGVFFRRVKRRKNHNVAVVAAARKLVVIAWHMLTNNEPYRYAQPRLTQDKLGRLRVRVTALKRKTGPRKGQPASAAYGTGQRLRKDPPLNEVMQQEGLPPATPASLLKPGEKAALKRMGCDQYAVQIEQPLYTPRAARTKTGVPG